MPRRICTTLKVCSGLPRTLHVFPFCFLLRSPSPISVRGGAVVLPDPYVGRSPRRPSTEGRSSGFLVRTSCCPSLRRARIFWRHHEQINHVLMQRRQNLTGRCCNCAVSRGLSCSTTVSLLFRFCSPALYQFCPYATGRVSFSLSRYFPIARRIFLFVFCLGLSDRVPANIAIPAAF